MTKKSKTLIASIIAPILLAGILPGTAIAISNTINENSNKNIQYKNDDSSYMLNNTYFDNEEEMMNYINENITHATIENKYPVKYTVKNDPTYSEFDSVDGINNFIKGKITPYTVNTSKTIQTGAMGEISPNEFFYLNGDDRSSTIDIWRGKNNKPYKNEWDAKMSYYEPHNGYFYKNAYFSTIQQLEQYLYANRDEWYENKVVSSIKLKAPNGQESQPIQISDLKAATKAGDNSTIKEYIKNFVRVNAKDVIAYDKGDGSRPDYFDRSQINSFINSNYYSPNYISVKSNGGKSTYILDSDKDDTGQLNGPYLASSGESVSGFKKTELWRETTNLDRAASENEQKLALLSTDLNTIFGSSEVPENDTTIKNPFFKFTDTSLQSKIDQYYKDLNDFYPSVYSKIEENFKIIKNGKRYGAFYKIPLLYLMTLDELMNYSAVQEIIDETIDVFGAICDFYNDQIIASKGTANLTHATKGEREMFSFKKLFGIGEKNLDLDYDVSSLINKIIKDYPNFYTSSRASIIFTSFKAKLGFTTNMKLDFDMLRDSYGLDIDDSMRPWYQTMFDISFTNNYNQLNTANTLFSMPKADLERWNPTKYAGISQFYYNNFCEQWISSIVIGEAIRYRLIDNKNWIYTDKQLDLLRAMNFMGVYDVVNEDVELKYEDNIKYMKELYKKNNKQIENIFFIILSIFDKQSKDSLRKLFGEPELYSNEAYSQKIFSKFQKEIMSDYDLFNDCLNDVFGVQPENVSYLARSHDFMSNDYFEDSKDNNQALFTISDSVADDKFKSLTNLPLTSIEAESFTPNLKPVQSEGKPFFIIEDVVEKDNKTKSNDKKIKISIPDPNKYGRNSFFRKLSNNKTISDSDWNKIFDEQASLVDENILNNFVSNKTRIIPREIAQALQALRTDLGNVDISHTVSGIRLEAIVNRNKRQQFAINRTFNQMILRQNGVLNNLNTAIEGISQYIGFNLNSYMTLMTNNANLTESINTATARVNTLNRDIKSHEDTIKENKKGIKTRENRIKDIKNGKTEFPLTEQERQYQIGRLENEIAHLNADNYNKNQDLNRWKTERKNLNSQISKNRSQIKANKRAYQKEINRNKMKSHFGNVFAKFTTAMVYVDMALSIIHFALAFKETISPLSYIYSNGDVSVIWDGGYRKSRFYGRIQGDSKTISDANFITPVQISSPKYQDQYYYNGYLYDSVEQIKSIQANDILRGTYSSPNVKFMYSFNKDIENTLEKDYVDTDIEKLGDTIFDALKKYADMIPTIVSEKDDLKTYDKYLPSFAYIYSFATAGSNNIYEIIEGDVMGSINKIKSRIKPVKIAYLPKLKNNTSSRELESNKRYPITNDKLPVTVNDGSVPAYELPVRRWDEEQNQLVPSNNNGYSYVLIDTNQPQYSSLDTDKKIDNKLRELFAAPESFDVPKKTVLKSDFDFIEKFSDFSNSVDRTQIYEAKGAFGQVRYFRNEDDAINWLWSNYSVETHYYINTYETYLYENMIFNSRNEILDWINKNKEVIIWKE